MKLVRDRIDTVPWAEDPREVARLRAEHLGWVAPDSPEYRRLLRAKLLEECAELLDADQRGDPDAVLEEAADVFEVLLTMVALAGRPFDSRHEARLKLAGRAGQKHFERGGFLQGRTWSGPERAGHSATVCVNDTNGDGDCAACAHDPQAPYQRPVGHDIPARLADWSRQRERERTCRTAPGHCTHPSATPPDLVSPGGIYVRCCRCAAWLAKNVPAGPPGSPQSAQDARGEDS